MRIFYFNANSYKIKTDKNKICLITRAIAVMTAVALFCCLVTDAHAGEKEQQDPSLQLYAQSAVLMDAQSGRILYGKNAQDVLPMASTTKIMTCILALEYGNPEEIVEVSSYATSWQNLMKSIRMDL